MKGVVVGMIVALALLIVSVASAGPVRHGRPCGQLYTVAQAQTRARAVYAGTRTVRRSERLTLGYMQRCQRNPAASAYVRWYEGHQRSLWAARHLSYTFASQYDDAGATASGFHATYGIATCGSEGVLCVAFGTRVRVVYHGRSVIAVVDDHGPYVAGRGMDLNQNVAAAVGFNGLGTVGWAIVR